ERVVEHPTVLQVGQEAGPGVFHGRGKPAVPLEVVRVRVVAALPDLDERDAALDKLAGEQAALAEFAIAVEVLVLGPLRVDLERLAALLQPAGGFVSFAVHLRQFTLALRGVAVLDERPQVVPLRLLRRLHVRHGERRKRALASNSEGLILRAEEPGTG